MAAERIRFECPKPQQGKGRFGLLRACFVLLSVLASCLKIVVIKNCVVVSCFEFRRPHLLLFEN